MVDTYRIMTKKDLSEQVLFDGDKVIASISNPTHSVENGLIKHINEEKPVLIGYDNTVVLPYQNPLVSFGHFVLAKALSDSGVDFGNQKKIVDLGCGAGFTGNYIAKNFDSVKNGEVVLADLSPNAIRAALSAYDLNSKDRISVTNGAITDFYGENDTRIRGIAGNVMNTLNGEIADICLATPLFIPGLLEIFPQAYQIFGATAKNMGSDFYFTHSSMADDYITQVVNMLDGKLENVVTRKMPLSVPENHSNLEMMKSLGLEKSNGQFYHDLKVSKMMF